MIFAPAGSFLATGLTTRLATGLTTRLTISLTTRLATGLTTRLTIGLTTRLTIGLATAFLTMGLAITFLATTFLTTGVGLGFGLGAAGFALVVTALFGAKSAESPERPGFAAAPTFFTGCFLTTGFLTAGLALPAAGIGVKNADRPEAGLAPAAL